MRILSRFEQLGGLFALVPGFDPGGFWGLFAASRLLRECV